jgi:3-oxoacyl-[acyl-carrier-protein] synthase II
MKPRRLRVAVTGLGAITALARGASQTFARLAAGECGIGAIEAMDASSAKIAVAAEVKGLRIRDVAPAGMAGIYSRADAMALVAATEAIEQASVRDEHLLLAVGTTGGGVREAMPWLMDPTASPLDPAVAQALCSYPLYGSATRLTECFGNIRHSATFCSACSSSATAIVQAALWVAAGRCQCAIAGGTESLSLLTLTGFSALGAMSAQPCRPFDAARSGMTLGEGAAFLVLESEAHALARGAQVLAWLDGWSLGAEAHHITQPEPSGQTAARLISEALHHAGLSPRDIDYFNAHGTGTVPNDSMEANALRLAFEQHANQVLVSTVKGQLGHTLGASGAVEAAMTVLALQQGIVPPTIGLSTPAEDTQLNHVIGGYRKLDCRRALSSSFGFGGMGTVLLFSHLDTSCTGAASNSRSLVITAAVGRASEARGAHSTDSGTAAPIAPKCNESLLDDPLAALDPDRSRRFDRVTALACTGIERALASAETRASHTGLVVGNAFGNVSRLSANMSRVKARGPRGMPPAEFPQLVQSSIAGNASIYHGLDGPVTTLSDAGLCCAAAFDWAHCLIDQGHADVMVAGVVEARDDGADMILDPYAALSHRSATRGDLSDWFVFESEEHARNRKRTPLARIIDSQVVAGQWYQALVDRRPPLPAECSCLILHGVDSAALDRVPQLEQWRSVPRLETKGNARTASGTSSGALLLAVNLLQQGQYREVTVIAKSDRQVWAIRLGASLDAG